MPRPDGGSPPRAAVMKKPTTGIRAFATNPFSPSGLVLARSPPPSRESAPRQGPTRVLDFFVL